MKCQECPDRIFREDKVGRTKYITRAECKPGTDHGIITVEVGKNYIGKTFRVVIEEVPAE